MLSCQPCGVDKRWRSRWPAQPTQPRTACILGRIDAKWRKLEAGTGDNDLEDRLRRGQTSQRVGAERAKLVRLPDYFTDGLRDQHLTAMTSRADPRRSEERRVGKECRC